MDKLHQNTSIHLMTDGYFSNQSVMDECFQNNITWSWWMLWHTNHLYKHNKEDLIRIYNHDLVLTRDELPNIMDYLNAGGVVQSKNKVSKK